MNLKRVTVIGTILFCTLFTGRFAGYGQTKGHPQESKDSKDVVATINGDRVITKKEIDESIGVKLYELERKIYFLREAALTNLIAKVLLEEEAKAKNITVAELKRQLIPDKVDVKQEKVDEAYNDNASTFANLNEDEAKERLRLDIESHEKMAKYKASLDALRSRAEINIFLVPPSLPIAKLTAEGPSKGDYNSPVTIFEFSDFQCPYCKQVAPTLNKLQQTYKDKVRVVYKHLPLSMHPQALAAAQASVCAGKQGRFWEYHDRLFDANTDLSIERLKTIASEMGLAMGTFNSCLESEESRTAVLDDIRAAKKLNIQGTPTLIINSKILVGAPSFENLKKAVDEELSRGSKGEN